MPNLRPLSALTEHERRRQETPISQFVPELLGRLGTDLDTFHSQDTPHVLPEVLEATRIVCSGGVAAWPGWLRHDRPITYLAASLGVKIKRLAVEIGKTPGSLYAANKPPVAAHILRACIERRPIPYPGRLAQHLYTQTNTGSICDVDEKSLTYLQRLSGISAPRMAEAFGVSPNLLAYYDDGDIHADVYAAAARLALTDEVPDWPRAKEREDYLARPAILRLNAANRERWDAWREYRETGKGTRYYMAMTEYRKARKAARREAREHDDPLLPLGPEDFGETRPGKRKWAGK